MKEKNWLQDCVLYDRLWADWKKNQSLSGKTPKLLPPFHPLSFLTQAATFFLSLPSSFFHQRSPSAQTAKFGLTCPSSLPLAIPAVFSLRSNGEPWSKEPIEKKRQNSRRVKRRKLGLLASRRFSGLRDRSCKGAFGKGRKERFFSSLSANFSRLSTDGERAKGLAIFFVTGKKGLREKRFTVYPFFRVWTVAGLLG